MASELHCTNLTLYGQITMEGKWSAPIGYVYFQLPGEPDPDELYYGTWSNVSSDYAGDFFRVEGGGAAAFGNSQTDQFQGHEHRQKRYSAYHRGITGPEPQWEGITNTATVGIVAGSNGTPRYGNETRPVNQTMRVWKRVS